MSTHVFGVKLISEPTLAYCHIGKETLMKFKSKYDIEDT